MTLVSHASQWRLSRIAQITLAVTRTVLCLFMSLAWLCLPYFFTPSAVDGPLQRSLARAMPAVRDLHAVFDTVKSEVPVCPCVRLHGGIWES